MRVAFAGTPAFAVPALEALAARHEVVGVLTQPDRPAGRGRILTPGPVKQLALLRGFPVAQPASLRTPEGQAALAAFECELLVVVAYGLILPPAVLDLPKYGCLNIHGSLLPRWRGAAPIHRAILAGDAETGVTIMRLEAGLDTGPTYLMRAVPIGPQSTSATLHDELARLGAEALLEVIDSIARGTAVSTPQPVLGVTYAAKIEKSEARIDWSRSASEIDRQVRAFDPWPVAETVWCDETLRVWGASLDDRSDRAAPGTILEADRRGVLVACGEGALRLTRVQRPGRKVVEAHTLDAADVLLGEVLGVEAGL